MSNQGTSNQTARSGGGRRRKSDWESQFEALIKNDENTEHSAEDMRVRVHPKRCCTYYTKVSSILRWKMRSRVSVVISALVNITPFK